jgi:hypothetical protein
MHHKGHCVGGETCILFEVLTPLGFTVRTTVKYWSLIETKHPKLRGRAQEVVGVLGHPDQSARADKTPLSICFTVLTSLAFYAL